MTRSILLALFAAALLLGAESPGWKIALEPKAALKAGPEVPVEVTVKDAKGAPVAGADVQLVLTMVEMDHGETKVPARQSAPGVYQSKARFMMEGKWNIEVRAKKGAESSTMKQQVNVE